MPAQRDPRESPGGPAWHAHAPGGTGRRPGCGGVSAALSPGVHAHDGAQQLAALERLVPPLLPLPFRGRVLRDPALLHQGECGLARSLAVGRTGEAAAAPQATPASAWPPGWGCWGGEGRRTRPFSHPVHSRWRPGTFKVFLVLSPPSPPRPARVTVDARHAGEEGRGGARSQRPLAGAGFPAVLCRRLRLLQLHGQRLLQQR